MSSRYDITWCSRSLTSFILDEHGIPEGPNHLIPLFVKSRCHLFLGASNIYLALATDITPAFYLDDVPANTKALRISIDPFMAVSLGVKFFHTKSAHLVATGNWDKKIPLRAFNSVVELEFTKETLKWIVLPHDQPPFANPRHALHRRRILRFSPTLFTLTYMLYLKFVVRSAYCTYLMTQCRALSSRIYPLCSRSWQVLPMWPSLQPPLNVRGPLLS